jgi:putative hydroxymethylpyrimidine transport system substrate-binding protein
MLRQRRRIHLVAAVAVVITAALGGCGSSSSSTRTSASHRPTAASLMLDFTPNAIHSGIYLAMARRYDRQAGVALHLQVPGESTDAINLLDTGRVNFAILDIHDLAIADAQGRHLVGLMAIVERPLASVIAQPQFTSPRALIGQTVGVSGDPSDLAVLRSIVKGAGGDPSKLKTLTIGYDAVPDLLDGRVAAATAFWNDEGVQLAHTRPGFHVFRVENFGAPPYPELVLTTTAAELHGHRALAAAVVHSIRRGYEAVLKDPGAGVRALTSQATGLNTESVREQLTAELPAFKPAGGGRVGALEPRILREWADWEVKFGIVKRRPNVTAMFDTGL